MTRIYYSNAATKKGSRKIVPIQNNLQSFSESLLFNYYFFGVFAVMGLSVGLFVSHTVYQMNLFTFYIIIPKWIMG